MDQVCADCGSRAFRSCFTESFPARAVSGTAVTVTLRLCLQCGARFAERASLREYLLQKLPVSARQLARA